MLLWTRDVTESMCDSLPAVWDFVKNKYGGGYFRSADAIHFRMVGGGSVGRHVVEHPLVKNLSTIWDVCIS